MIKDADVRRPAADVLAQALHELPPRTAEALRALGHLKCWEDGELILHNGLMANSVCLILSGQVRMVASTPEGDEVFLRWFGPGEFAGVASVLGRIPFPSDAIASGTVEAVQLDASEFRRHLATDPEGALAFAARVSHFAAELVALLAAFTSGSLEKRIVSLLRRLVAHQPAPLQGEGVRLTLSQQDIAYAIGASRQRVSMELQKLEKSGYIRLGYRHLVVLRALSG
ncbi:hypothetical protein C7T35_27465 [Variovorax sp. WS11]|uniref:Crp/Fnr family transcriptional regulator n=1 Tax=Variovorax sp. WS11 TaxID=1105204 RepID=UPI000D0D2988|nr:Crp/Fnr family transcriptional regulator [Variovorax sp. WS11]NDZ17002.1 Crp/Fnr family transcriptional regulator [Variovorax sp. WS11]PSL81389.1 hypothetical protein C7T35_27465 [Variovorax sp. WS11]